jgi:hypothetical protein
MTEAGLEAMAAEFAGRPHLRRSSSDDLASAPVPALPFSLPPA